MTEPAIEIVSAPRVGFAGEERIFAMIIDYTLVFLTAMLATTMVRSNVVKGSVFAVAAFAYFLVPEWLLSTSPAKALFGLRIERVEGGPCSFRGALSRTLFRLLEVNPVLSGALPGGIAIMRSPLKQRLGDRFGGVLVVRTRRSRTERRGWDPMTTTGKRS